MRRNKKTGLSKGMRIAASLLFIGAIGVLLYFRQGLDPVPLEQSELAVRHQSFETPKGKAETENKSTDLKFRYPVAVIIDNAPAARPQAGLSQADIVYEALAEGGVPRYMAIFMTIEDSIKIGPIRSVRPYFIDIAAGYRAILVHCGGSAQALANLAKNTDVYNLDEMQNSRLFSRSADRRPPHNLYSTIEQLSIRSEDAPELVEAAPQLIEDRERPANSMIITYNRDYRVMWTWDAIDEVYRRSVMDTMDIDRNTGRQITASAIIVQNVPCRTTDEVGHLDMEIVGDGEAVYFTGGFRSEIEWTKKSSKAPITYITSNGKKFLPGRGTWIELVPEGSSLVSR